MPKVKYYAVKIGREGPKIYSSWDECKDNTQRIPGAVHKSFTTRSQAEAWLNEPVKNVVPMYWRTMPDSDGWPLPTGLSATSVIQSPDDLKRPDTPGPSILEKRPDWDHEADFLPFEEAPNKIVLSDEQEAILNLVQQGKNVFFTGSAGTGKSVLLREIIRSCESRGMRKGKELAVTASTGIASVNIGGMTIHSWAGIGQGEDKATDLAKRIIHSPRHGPRNRWRTVQTLVVDEISMIDGKLFDKLDYVARTVCGRDRPFAGIQLVISGDFCQLPPVPGRGKLSSTQFAFESVAWKQCIARPVVLTKVFRQQDQHFVDMLNAVRVGQLTEQIVNVFRSLSRPVTYTDGIEPTELFPTRHEVAEANRSRLLALPAPPHTYLAMDTPGHDDEDKRISIEAMGKLLDRLVAQKEIVLKVGAQVMLIKNLVQGRLVNGSLGQVIDFVTSQEAMERRMQVAQTEPEDNPEKRNKIPAEVMAMGLDRLWPVVRFTNGDTMVCVPAEFTVNNSAGGMEAKREQIPLICAWALSVHKSQGQTLQRVRVDLGRTFEKGQAYVALSRATNMETLQVINFHPERVMAHPRVLKWYRSVLDTDDSDHDSAEDLFDEMDNDEAIAAYYQATRS